MSIIIEFKITRTFRIFIKESAKAGYRMRRTVQICHPERGSFPKLLYRLLSKAFNASLVSELQKSTKRLVERVLQERVMTLDHLYLPNQY